MPSQTSQRLPVIVILLAMIVATLAYWIGLSGPFLLDDFANLRAIPEWLDGKLGFGTLLFERGAGMFGRPVSMASLALNAAVGGFTPFSLKLGNLVVHLACGAVIFGLLRQLLRLDMRLQARAPLVAAIVAALWLLHPLHVSTVLYAVQRMAQVSTLFILLGLWMYLAARERLERGPSTAASASLLLGVPAMTVIAFLGKENGALLPLLCLVLELTWFHGGFRQSSVRAFHALYVLIPGLVGISALTLRPERFLGGYAGRDFTFIERLLTQPRALCDYLFKLIVPNPPTMGIYTDDFPISNSLLAPPSTLIALLVLIALSVMAWHWRKKLPAVCFGWYFFLAAHALESTVIPLEMYFEHRNYLPSVGIVLALVVLAATVGDALARKGVRTGRIGIVLTLGALAVLTLGTHGRARVWRSDTLIAESSLQAHPHSLRANAAVMTAAINQGDRARANEAIEAIIRSPEPRHQSLGHAFRLLVECENDQKGRPEDFEFFVTQTPMPLTLYELQPFERLFLATSKQGCSPFSDKMFGAGLAELAARSSTQNNQPAPWTLHYQAASFLLRGEDWKGALAQSRLAWQRDADPQVAMPLVLAELHLGDVAAAEKTMREVIARTDPTNADEQAIIGWLREQIEAARRANANSPKAGPHDPSDNATQPLE